MTSTNGTGATLAPANEPMPTTASPPNGITLHGFTIQARKLPILKAGPIEAMTNSLGIAVPEMIFGDNRVTVSHPASGWSIDFNAHDALDRVDKTGAAMLQVAHSGEWKASREHHHEEIKEVVKPFDWSYSTDYKGTVTGKQFANSETEIPIQLLKRPDPIRFFDEVVLYEDELADNGITMLTVKVRVMPERMLVLSRFFMRLDGVLFRIRDTRIFVEFATGMVLREYTAREESFEKIRHALAGRHDVQALLRDANRLSELIPVVERVNEELTLP